MKTLILILLFSSPLIGAEVVYSTSTLQIVESGLSDKSRFIGDPNYVIVDVPDSEVEKIDGKLNRFVFNPNDKTINKKSEVEIKKIESKENKAKIIDLKTKLATLQSLRSSETDTETIEILDERIKEITDLIAK